MPFFRYEAVDRNGRPISGTMDAPSEDAVATRLTQQGFSGLNILPPRSPSNGASAPSRTPAAASRGARAGAPGAPRNMTAPPKDCALFYRQFAALVRSGISLYQALDTLGPRTSQPALRFAAREMAEAARSGSPITSVMERRPTLFPDHIVSCVRGAETGGFLDVVLDEIAYEYEQHTAFLKGMWLPRALVVQELFALALAQPLFPTLFPNAQPALYAAYAGRNCLLALALLMLIRAVLRWLSLPGNTLRRDALILRLPVLGDLARQRSLAAFVRMLRRLYNAGVGPIGCWEGAMHVAENEVIRRKLVDAYEGVRAGEPIHDAFMRTGLFANETEQLLATGVVSGQVVEMLDRVAEYYQQNVDRAFGNARFWLYRLSITLFIVLSGMVLIVLVRTYFDAVFNFTKGWTD
jgi:type II secretory pathway component PulF